MKKAKVLFCLMGVLVILAFLLNCSDRSSVGPLSQSNDGISVAGPQDADLAKATPLASLIKVQNRHTKKLLENEGIIGTAAGQDENGRPVILVFTKEEKDKSSVPSVLDNVPVVVEVTGVVYAYGKKAEPRVKTAPLSLGVSHVAKQTPPIKLGASGGWALDLANGYCCGGTLGSLITDGVNKYILSNYHVLQADIVLGGNGIVAKAGDNIIQPGLIDVNCNAAAAQAVATLSAVSFPPSLPDSNVDAAIAQIIPGKVDTTGAILEIGTISKNTVAAFLNQKVKKSGRTSKLTSSYVSGLNASIKVTYESECAGTTAFTKTFTGQIIVKNGLGKFLESGDSGSLLVEGITVNPKAVGLLFAGSSTLAVANPINDVLGHFSAVTGKTFSMVGK